MYKIPVPWNPLFPSRVRISGPRPHTTKYSKILVAISDERPPNSPSLPLSGSLGSESERKQAVSQANMDPRPLFFDLGNEASSDWYATRLGECSDPVKNVGGFGVPPSSLNS